MYIVAAFFSTAFGLVNILFAFYNLFQLTVVNRHMKGMTMKINLCEKALIERRLPTDIMGRVMATSMDSGNEK